MLMNYNYKLTSMTNRHTSEVEKKGKVIKQIVDEPIYFM